MTPTLASFVTDFATLVIAIWAAVELLGKHFPRIDRSLMGVVLGPAFALTAFHYGFISPAAVPVTGKAAYGAVAFGGLIATLVSQLFHDFVTSPLAKKMNGVS